jgi:hypothetical protein
MHGNLNVMVAFGDDPAVRIDAMPATIGEIIRTIQRFEEFFGSSPLSKPKRLSEVPPSTYLTASQAEQLHKFLEEQDDFDGRVALRLSASLGMGYIEAVLLDADGQETAVKRVLFP